MYGGNNMNYDEMVKIAYEDILDGFEKEAANRLFRDGVDGATEALRGRFSTLKSLPAAEIKKNPAAIKAYSNTFRSNSVPQGISGVLGVGSHGTASYDSIRNKFRDAQARFKQNPADTKALQEMKMHGKTIKDAYRGVSDALSNHTRTPEQLRLDAVNKKTINKGNTGTGFLGINYYADAKKSYHSNLAPGTNFTYRD
jgi:hypothetical protein